MVMFGQSKAGIQPLAGEVQHPPLAQAITGAWEYKISSISLSDLEKLCTTGSKEDG